MKWNRGYQSDDVEVRQGSSGGGGGGGGLPGGILSLIASRFGIGGVVIAVLAFGILPGGLMALCGQAIVKALAT